MADNVMSRLPEERLNRTTLEQAIADQDTTPDGDLARFCLIMAWGGLQSFHGTMALAPKNHDRIKHLLQQLRSESLDTAGAYALHLASPIPGIGPAYFTKLVCFIGRKGVILDRWVAQSVNLICERGVVVLNRGGFVTNANDPENYVNYCSVVSSLATDLLGSPDHANMVKIEEELFSWGGPKPLPWRAHVTTAWLKERWGWRKATL